MQRNKETPFERKSKFNPNRTSYFDKDFNYVYEYQEAMPDGSYATKRYVIPYSEENKEIFIMLDKDDHDTDLGDRYDDENADYTFQNKQTALDTEDEDFRDDPIDCIADKSADTFSLLFQEEAPTDPRIAEITEWIHSLPESQINLIYEHLGAMKFLEDIRREEELCTAKAITKQAMHNRWNKIIAKACKHFGVDKPKQNHCK